MAKVIHLSSKESHFRAAGSLLYSHNAGANVPSSCIVVVCQIVAELDVALELHRHELGGPFLS